jgi:hypothetical protein
MSDFAAWWSTKRHVVFCVLMLYSVHVLWKSCRVSTYRRIVEIPRARPLSDLPQCRLVDAAALILFPFRRLHCLRSRSTRQIWFPWLWCWIKRAMWWFRASIGEGKKTHAVVETIVKKQNAHLSRSFITLFLQWRCQSSSCRLFSIAGASRVEGTSLLWHCWIGETGIQKCRFEYGNTHNYSAPTLPRRHSCFTRAFFHVS